MENIDEAMKEIDRLLGLGIGKKKTRLKEIVRNAEGKMRGEVNAGACAIEVDANPAALLIIISETLFSIEKRTGMPLDEFMETLHELMEARRRGGD